MSDSVVILSGCRTPIGSFCSAFATVPAQDLGAVVIEAAIKRAAISSQDVNEVVLGQTYTAGCGQNPARQAAIKAGVPQEVPAYSLNMLCGSGLKAIMSGYQSIRSGESNVIVAGGQENMSRSPHVIHLRAGVHMGPADLTDSLLHDGLTDAFNTIHMGITAENVAEKYNISRQDQDDYALISQIKTQAAIENGCFNEEIVPVSVSSRKGTVTISADEFPKKDASIESLNKLRTVFKKDGTVTAGNATGINDGAAALVLASLKWAEAQKLKPLARIVGIAQTGIDPKIMGIGPVSAVKLLLERIGWSIDDVDLFELNEPFAAQAVAVQRELNVPTAKVNVNGGAIALGHPIGASGARVVVTLINALQQRKMSKGVASLCVGGGMGVAIAIELLPVN